LLQWYGINLGGEDEVALGEAVDLVCPDFDSDFSPREKDVGMMILLVGNRPNGIDKMQRLVEIGKLVALDEMVVLDNVPTFDLRQKLSDLLGGE